MPFGWLFGSSIGVKLAAAMAVAGLLGAIGIAIHHAYAEKTRLTAMVAEQSKALDQLETTNQTMLESLDQYKADTARAISALVTERNSAVKEQAWLSGLAARLSTTARIVGQDGPLAPVLQEALAGLRESVANAEPTQLAKPPQGDRSTVDSGSVAGAAKEVRP